jgi:O-antigen/teichoic acid export membrane protein
MRKYWPCLAVPLARIITARPFCKKIDMASLNKHLITAFAGYFFRYAYLFVLIPFYAHVLGPEAYGIALAAMSIQSIVWTIQNWGFAFTGIRNIAAASSSADRNHEYSRHLSARVLLMPLSIAAGLIAVYSSTLLREHILASSLAITCGVIAGFNLGWYFQGRMQFKTPVMLEILGFCITLPLVLLTVKGPADVNMVLLALTISSILSSATAYFWAARDERQVLAPWVEGRSLIKESTPLFLSSAAFMMLTTVGTYSLSLFSTADQVGYFGTAEKFITAGLGLLGPAGQVMLSWFSKMVSENHDTHAVFLRQKRAVILVAAVGFLVMMGTIIASPYIFTLILGEKFEHAATLLILMSPVFFLAALGNAISVYVLLPDQKEKIVSQISIISTLIGATLIGVGAYLDNARGAAIARVLSEAISTGLLIIQFRIYKNKQEQVKNSNNSNNMP